MSERILVAQTGYLGDVVLTTGLLAALRSRFPGAEIAAMVTPAASGLLAGHPAVDRVLIDDKRGRNRSLVGLVRTAVSLRREQFSIALAAHKSPRTALLLAAAGIPFRVGFRLWPQALLYSERVEYDTSRHYACRQLALLRPFGVGEAESEKVRLSVAISEESRGEAGRILEGLALPFGAPLVGICPGSAWATKRWPAERYGELVRELEARGFCCIIFGAREDQGVARQVMQSAGGNGRDLTGRTSIDIFTALLERMEVVVTNDSSPMHLASALQLPLVAIFCSTVPSQGYGPLSPAAVVVEQMLECRPCGRHGSMRCPLGTDACRVSVEVRQVLAGLEQALRRVGRLPNGRVAEAGNSKA